MDLENINRKLEDMLQNKRLICEVSCTKEEIESWRDALVDCGEETVWQRYPALTAIVTVGIGVHDYHDGEFWPSFPGIKNQNIWGKQFEKFIQSHKTLEAFRSMVERGALRFIAPILAHGGIPQHYLDRYFELITKYADSEEPASEFINFLKENEKTTNNIVTSVRRFLREGGEPAEDLVARTLAIWQSRELGDGGGSYGLPLRISEAFSVWYTKFGVKIKARKTRQPRLPRPCLKLEPGGIGVYMYLPRCDSHPLINSNDIWQLEGKSFAISREHHIPLKFCENWSAEINGHPMNQVGISEKEPALFFNTYTGKVIPDPASRRLPEDIWAIYNSAIQPEPKPVFQEELLAWPGNVVAVFDLLDYKKLVIEGRHYEVRQPFFHIDPEPIVAGILSDTGLPIYDSAPAIFWEGGANLSFSHNGKKKENIEITTEEFQMWFDELGEYEFILRGAFGQNIRKQFVLFPGINKSVTPEVFWPDTKSVKFEFTSDQIGIIGENNTKPPFYCTEPVVKFRAENDNTSINLIATVPKLQWRVVMTGSETSEWSSSPDTLKIEEIEKAVYPSFICNWEQSSKSISVMLEGKHGKIKSPQGCRSEISDSYWVFDLRIVKDEVVQSGQAEEFEIVIRDSSLELYRGLALTVRPHWDLDKFEAKWKNIDGEHVIKVSWFERGNPIQGRWLVLIPVWRPWEKPITQELKDNEIASYDWTNKCIGSGHYFVRAVRAEWGSENWKNATYLEQETIDIFKEGWPDFYCCDQQEPVSVKRYTEILLAHWYKPELVANAPISPENLSSNEIKLFLNYLDSIDEIQPLKIPKDGSGSLAIFCMNPASTTEAVESKELSDLWQQVLPSREILNLIPKPKDLAFIEELAFQYTNIDTAIKSIRIQHKRKFLSEPLQNWHKNLGKHTPPVDEIIFLWEKFNLVNDASPKRKSEYIKLKQTYQKHEAI